jgi:putative transposase
MARLLKVSRPGFYAWRLHRREEVRKAHIASHGTNGAPRVVRELAHQGNGVDRKTVSASMRRQGVEEISPRQVRPAAPIGEVYAHAILDLVRRCCCAAT